MCSALLRRHVLELSLDSIFGTCNCRQLDHYIYVHMDIYVRTVNRWKLLFTFEPEPSSMYVFFTSIPNGGGFTLVWERPSKRLCNLLTSLTDCKCLWNDECRYKGTICGVAATKCDIIIKSFQLVRSFMLYDRSTVSSGFCLTQIYMSISLYRLNIILSDRLKVFTEHDNSAGESH